MLKFEGLTALDQEIAQSEVTDIKVALGDIFMEILSDEELGKILTKRQEEYLHSPEGALLGITDPLKFIELSLKQAYFYGAIVGYTQREREANGP